VTIAADTQPGTLIRLKSRGLRSRSGPVGDILIRVQASIPKQVDANILDQIRAKYQK
jgi:DnaJ-class molecular chaperone